MASSNLFQKGIKVYQNLRQPFWAMGSQVVTSGGNFLTTIIIIKTLGLEEFGRFSICFLLLMIARNFLIGIVLVPMSAIGPKIPPSVTKYYKGFLFSKSLIFAIGSSIFLGILTFPLSVAVSAPWLPAMILPIMLANFTAVMSDFLKRFHFVYGRPILAFSVDFTRFVTQLVTLIVLSWGVIDGFSSETALQALAFGGMVGIITGLVVLGVVNWHSRLSRKFFSRHLKFIKWMVPSTVLEAIQGPGILIVAGVFLSDAALGGVRAMQNLANTLNLPFNALQQVAPSLASRELIRSNKALLKFLTKLFILITVMVTGITIILIFDVGFWISLLFGQDLVAFQTVLIVFCGLNLALAARLPVQVFVQVYEKPKYIFISDLFATFFSLVSLFSLAALGEVAVPLTRFIGILISLAILLVFSRYLLKNISHESNANYSQ